MLLEDSSSLDWEAASYSTELIVGDGYATVTHMLKDAPQLQSLVDQDKARWALELRCPTTLLSRWELSETTECMAKWDQTEVQGELYFTPGMITINPISLTSEGLSDLWTFPIKIPRGCWLVRGDVTRAKSLAASLLTFHSTSRLSEGEMEVRPDISSGDLHFKVYVSEKLFPHCPIRRDLQIAALVAAFGRIPHLDNEGDSDGDDEASEYRILSSIKERLRELNVPVWGEGQDENFDPARAATAIEQFSIDQLSTEPGGDDPA